MVDRNLLREFDVNEDELTALVTAEDGSDTLEQYLGGGQSFEIGRIVSGRVVEIVGDQVVVDGQERLKTGAKVFPRTVPAKDASVELNAAEGAGQRS